jgi:FAD/FMN-containing dehydrogenase/Fe-S oxidoreductase
VDAAARDRAREDLKGALRGELLFDDLPRALYATDASPFFIEPIGVARPRDEDDLRVLVRYAAEHGLPLTARGAGTGTTGAALGAGLIIDFAAHFRDIVEVGADTVRAQPGVPLRALRDRLARDGRRLAAAPDGGEATVGGVVAADACGPRAALHGSPGDHVAALRVVLDSGDAVEAGHQPRWPAADAPQGRIDDVVSALVTLLDQNAALLVEGPPRTRFDRCGYAVRGALGPDHIDLARLLAGSEGTLALFAELTLRTQPLPGGRAAALLGFASLDAALRAARLAPTPGLSACELLDRRLLRLGREAVAGAADLVPTAAEAALLVEYEADTPAEASALAADLVRRLLRADRLALSGHAASADADLRRLWQVRDAALDGLSALRGEEQALPFLDGVGVPPERLAEYLHGAQELLQRHETTAAFLVHAATGQVEMRPFLAPRRQGELSRMWALADEVCALAQGLGGTIAARHGPGLCGAPWAGRQLGPLLPLHRAVKAVFDPRHLFNPGKGVGPAAPAWPLRPAPAEGAERALAGLRWRPDEAAREVLACNGCGRCRVEAAPQRMCPIFHATPVEEATPRAKADLMRSALTPGADPKRLSSTEARAVADLCVNCRMCAAECPARVNVPKLMMEAKAANVAEHGLDRADWVATRLESFLRLGSALAPLANALLRNRAARWLLEKLFGLSRRRRLPPLASISFLRLARRRGWTRKPRAGRRVVYFVDVFANYLDPGVAEATVAVLHHNGVEVYVPPGQWGSGMAALAQGDVETARDTVTHNLRLLGDLAREGMPIVCSEPTAALMFRQDAPDLVDDPDARLVAERAVELTAYLWGLHREGALRTDFRPLAWPVAHHVPCHVKALRAGAAGPDLLGLIPGLRPQVLDVSCSGMAGTFGLRAAAYDVSRAAGRPMLEAFAGPRALFGSTECGACRVQMEDYAGKSVLHPAQFLALAYGYLPELAERLRRPPGGADRR